MQEKKSVKKLTVNDKISKRGRINEGRPTKYTLENAAYICHGIIEDRLISDILKDIGITWTTLFDWQKSHPEFSQMYAEAKEKQTMRWEERIIEVATNGSGDFCFKEVKDKDGETAKPVFLAENVNRSRLIVDSLKWLMSKRLPKKYSDKQTIEHSGSVEITDLNAEVRKFRGDGN